MVESGMIDKYTHALDMERAVYDTIMLDNAVKLARDWAAARRRHADPGACRPHPSDQPDRHHRRRHGRGIPNVPLRERVGTYEKAGFPNYPAADREGYPPRVDVSRRLAILFGRAAGSLRDLPPKLDESRTNRR